MYDIQNEYEYAYDGEGCYDYESESDYESDYGDEEYADNDDAWANRDDEYDSVLSRTCVSEKPSLDKAVGMTVLAKPVQLAAKTSSFKTMMEAKFAAADKAKKEAEEKAKAERAEAQRLAEEKMKEELRLKAVVAHLPTESRAAKERRLKKEAEEKAKADAKAAKEKVYQQMSLGHRRNGGGKSRGRYAAEVDEKVVAERRAERRKEASMNRKIELQMNQKTISKATTTIKTQEPVIVEKVGEDEARMAWAVAGKDSDEFNLTEAIKLVETEEKKAESEAMAEVVQLVASKVRPDNTTKMQRIMAEQRKEAEEKAKAEAKASEDAWTEVKRVKKSKKPVVLKMGQASHRETMRKRTPKKEEDAEEVRSVAHDKLSDKKEMEKTLTKTRLCKSLETGEVCRHGARCRFAHSLEELVIAKCVFGVECRRVECGVDGCYKNCGDKVCTFIHPDEDKDGFYVRTGLKKETVPVKAVPVKAVPVKTVPVKAVPVKAVPVKGWDMSKLTAPVKVVEATKVEVPGEGWAQVRKKSPVKPNSSRLCESVVKGIPCRHGANCRFSHSKEKTSPVAVKYVPPPTSKTVPVCESVALGIPCRHGVRCRFAHPAPTPPVEPEPKAVEPKAVEPEPVKPKAEEGEIVLRVPKEMFLQAMEMAMKSGKTNIRVEIIGS